MKGGIVSVLHRLVCTGLSGCNLIEHLPKMYSCYEGIIMCKFATHYVGIAQITF